MIMENTKTTETITQTPPNGDLPAEKLLAALYYIWDAFERANMPFFLVYQTARDVMLNHDLTGSKVEVGVRGVEWISGAKRVFDNFAGEPLEETPEKATYMHVGVPIVVHVYQKDDECIVQTDMVRYRYEEFKVPNPYQRFLEVYK
jgi:hypothetical protein